jgi:methionine-rich copper-binding protein CopC
MPRPIHQLFLTLAATLLMAAPAFAHAHLASASPAPDASVATAPAALGLHFTEGLDLAFSGVVVEDHSGATVTTGAATLKPGDDRTLIVPLSGALKAGRYEVTWHALSKDGHKTRGSYHFTITSK